MPSMRMACALLTRSSFSSAAALRRAASSSSRMAALLAAAALSLTTALRFLLFADPRPTWRSPPACTPTAASLTPSSSPLRAGRRPGRRNSAGRRPWTGERGGGGREAGGFGANGAKWAWGVLVSPTDRRARGGQARASRPSARCPFHPKPSASLGRGWVENGPNPNICPFEAARWAASFVPFTPNGRGRTG